MYVCYVDESGDVSALPGSGSPVQLALVVLGLVIRQDAIRPLTDRFLRLKTRFFPALAAIAPHFLDNILWEVKGSDLRKQVALGTQSERRHAIGFLDKALDLLTEADARLIARVWIKGLGLPFKGTEVYTSSVQAICAGFQAFLAAQPDTGIVVADFRTKHLNARVSHAVFTQKYQTSGDTYDRLLEMPAFGHSDNHAGIQLADLLASALLFPMALRTYCTGHVTNPTHVRPGYSRLVERYGTRLKNLQYRYQGLDDRWQGGITVSDALGHRSAAALFRHSASPVGASSAPSSPAAAASPAPLTKSTGS